jgi:hypothetical protein
MTSKITSRRATLADLVQCCEIYNYYILNTTFAMIEDPVSLIDLVERYRRVLEQGLPFVVLVYAEVQHEVLGFFAATSEPTMLAKFPGISFSHYMRPDLIKSGVFDKTTVAICRELGKHDNFRGILSFFNQINPVVNKRLSAMASGLNHNTFFVMRNGGFKFGKYLNLGVSHLSKKELEKFVRLKEHL